MVIITRSLQIVNGDVAISGSSVQFISGIQKLGQDMDCWTREQFGIDRFHPAYGSLLDSYVGGTITDTTAAIIEAEVLRVLSNYQRLQLARFNEDPSRFSQSELLDQIVSINAKAVLDAIYVDISVNNALGSNTTFTVNLTT